MLRLMLLLLLLLLLLMMMMMMMIKLVYGPHVDRMAGSVNGQRL